LCSGQTAFVLVDCWRVSRHEDECFHSCPSGVSSHRATGVSGGGNRQALDPELASHGDGHRLAPTLEAASGKLRLILDPKLIQAKWPTKSLTAEQRRDVLAERDHRRFVAMRQELAVAPHGLLTQSKILLRYGLRN